MKLKNFCARQDNLFLYLHLFFPFGQKTQLAAKRVIKDGVPVKFSCQKYCHKTTRNIEARNAKPFDVTINFMIQYYVQNKKGRAANELIQFTFSL